MNSMNGPASWMAHNSDSWNWASMLYPGLKKNGMQNGVLQIWMDKRSTVFYPGPGSLHPVFSPDFVLSRKNKK
jgi:hypothetical protein